MQCTTFKTDATEVRDTSCILVDKRWYGETGLLEEVGDLHVFG